MMYRNVWSVFCVPLTHWAGQPRRLASWLCLAAAAGLATGQIDSATAADDPEAVADGPWISSVAWQDDNTLLGTRSQSLLFRPAEVVQASADNPGELKVVGESPSALWSVLPAADGQAVASDYKGGVHLYSAGAEGKAFELDARWIRALAPSPTANEILAGTEDGKLLVLSVDKAQELRRVDAHAAAIFDIAVSAAGDKIATAAGDGTLKIFSWPELEPQGEMQVGREAIWSVAFVNQDKQLISGGADRAVQLWDVATASSIVTIASAHNWVTSLAPLPKSNLVLAGCMDGSIVVVDVKTMLAVAQEKVADSGIWSIALSPDGQRLALGTRKHGIAVVNVQPWKKAGRTAAQQARMIRPPAPKKG